MSTAPWTRDPRHLGHVTDQSSVVIHVSSQIIGCTGSRPYNQCRLIIHHDLPGPAWPFQLISPWFLLTKSSSITAADTNTLSLTLPHIASYFSRPRVPAPSLLISLSIYDYASLTFTYSSNLPWLRHTYSLPISPSINPSLSFLQFITNTRSFINPH